MKQDLARNSIKLTNSQLRQYNNLLRKNLKMVISCSEENEQSQRRIDDMEELLCQATELKVMFDSLIIEGKRLFSMDYITVTLAPQFKKFYPVSYHEGEGSFFINSEFVNFMGEKRMTRRFSDPTQPALHGNLRSGASEFFPGSTAKSVRSQALAPLHDGEKVVGVIAFGSRRPARFLEEHGIRFLKRLGRTLVLRVEYFQALGPENMEGLSVPPDDEEENKD